MDARHQQGGDGVNTYIISTIVDPRPYTTTYPSGVNTYKISTIVDLWLVMQQTQWGANTYKISTIVDEHEHRRSKTLETSTLSRT